MKFITAKIKSVLLDTQSLVNLDTCIFQVQCSYKHAKDQPPKEIIYIENTSKEVDQLKVDIKINILAKVHYNEQEELRNEITTLNKTLISNLEQYKSSLEQKDSELNQAIESLQNTNARHVELVSELKNKLNTLKLEILRKKKYYTNK